MNKNSRPASVSPAMSVDDIVYVLFKHKWKLITITLLGWAAALAFFFLAPPAYTSMAKLMVRYVVERSPLDHLDSAASPSAGRANESVILSEMEILTSWDLADRVANVPGMERLLPKSSGPEKAGAVASTIVEGLSVKAVPGSNVIQVYFKHQNPEMAQRVLDELIRQYFIKHLDVHRSKEAAKFVTEKVEQSRTKLRGAEEDVTKLKVENGILSLGESMKNLSEELERSEAELGDSETALAEQRARVASLEHFMNEEGRVAATGQKPKYSDHVLEVRRAEPAAPATPAKADAAVVESAGPKVGLMEINQFQSILAKLYDLKSNDLKLADKWAPNSTVMRQHKEQIAKLEDEEKEMLKKYPDLGAVARQTSANQGSRIDLVAERAQLEALEAKAGKLRESLNQTRKRVSELTQIAPKIVEKERMRDIEEINYRYMGSSLEKAQIDEALDGSKIPNISIVQEATPPVLDMKKRIQIIAAIAVGVPAAAIGLTLLFGLFLNKTVKRAHEVENRLGMPLVLSIPFFSGRSVKRLRGAKARLAQRSEVKNGELAPWDKEHFIVPYAEAIRDRLHTFFETQGITATPKLIGVSSFSRGSGASTLAAGLASALSNTDGDKVMLVDMNGTGAAARVFSGGKPVDMTKGDEALTDSKDDNGGEKLTAGPVDSLSTGAALGLSECRRLMGELKTRGCDYLVFDMPPVSDISPSASIGGLMDHVLAVVESEATMTDQVKRGYRDLAAAQATVSIVFNKARGYGSEMFAGA